MLSDVGRQCSNDLLTKIRIVATCETGSGVHGTLLTGCISICRMFLTSACLLGQAKNQSPEAVLCTCCVHQTLFGAAAMMQWHLLTDACGGCSAVRKAVMLGFTLTLLCLVGLLSASPCPLWPSQSVGITTQRQVRQTKCHTFFSLVCGVWEVW